MKLAKALKLKNRIVGEIKVIQLRMTQNNSHEKENKPDYDSHKMWEELQAASSKLVVLKVKIAAANGPIVPAILEIAEIKGFITMFQGLDTKDCIQQTAIGFDDKVMKLTYVAKIKRVEADAIIKKLTERLDVLQEKIDEHNATTQIRD